MNYPGKPVVELIFFNKLIIMVLVSLIFLSLWILSEINNQKNRSQLRRKQHYLKKKLAQQKLLLKSLFDHSLLATALLDMNGQFIQVNQSLCDCLGYAHDDILKMNFFHLIHSEELKKLQFHLQKLIDKKIPTYSSEQQFVRKNGDLISIILILFVVRNASGQPAYCIMQIQNITLQKKAEERLHHMAFHDSLTGLANRNRLEQFINEVILSARRHQRQFALMFLDLDHFKNINDTMGHEAGDLILQIIGDRLLRSVRATDMVARLAGDEFILLITDIKQSEDVSIVAEKILHQVLQVITIQGKEVYMTTSIGISLYPSDGKNIQTLLKNADLALYRSKELGRHNYQFYLEEMTKKVQKKLLLQRALAHALVNNEFLLNYQPKMELISQRITGVEVFLRWKNVELGNIPANQIIETAEETGLILPVSYWIIKTACQQLKKWHDAGWTFLSLAINCSGRQLKHPDFIHDLLQLINYLHVPAQAIELEVTERLIMEDTENIYKVLYSLKDKGIQVAIDDFGTGYWSLNNLRRLSVDKIKIDKSFIKNVTLDETSALITKAIIAMANKLRIKTVAEGVENKEQYDFLLREGCTEIQGYYLTHPLTDELMTKYLMHSFQGLSSNIKAPDNFSDI